MRKTNQQPKNGLRPDYVSPSDSSGNVVGPDLGDSAMSMEALYWLRRRASQKLSQEKWRF